MSNKITGGCQCGAVRFEAEGEPAFSSNCHCRDCQRASGSAYLPVMGFPKDAVRVTGEVKYFQRQGDSGAFESEGFCPECGARRQSRRPRAVRAAGGHLHGERTAVGSHGSGPAEIPADATDGRVIGTITPF